jgi:hypothetical protein
MTNAPTMGVPVVAITHHRLVARGRVPPVVMNHCWLGESSFCADAHLGLLLCRDADLCLLIGIGPRLPRRQ